MAWVATAPASLAGRVVGSGQCVAYVCQACEAPTTPHWTRGVLVKGSKPPVGTAIATFDPDGTYGNHTDGRSHAAIFHDEVAEGLLVWDQWLGHPVQPRLIHFRDGMGSAVNDGDRFYIVEPKNGSATA